MWGSVLVFGRFLGFRNESNAERLKIDIFQITAFILSIGLISNQATICYVSKITFKTCLIEIRMLARHRHIHTIKGIASLPLQSFLVLLSLSRGLVLTLVHLEILVVFCHLWRFSDVFRFEVALDKTRDMRRRLALLNYRLPVDIGTPRMCFDTTDLAFCDSPPRVLV